MRNLFWGSILVFLGILLLMDNLEMLHFWGVLTTYWPALLVLWGLGLLFRKPHRDPTTGFSDVAKKVEGELFHESNLFGDVDVHVTSKNFKGGSLSTMFGDCEVDLSDAIIADGEHWMRVNGVFGDCRVVIPEDVAISVSASGVFGDVHIFDQRKGGISPALQYSSPQFEHSVKKFKMHVSSVFGSIRIQHTQ